MKSFDHTLQVDGKDRGVKVEERAGNAGYSVSVYVDTQEYYQLSFLTFTWKPKVKDHPDRYIPDSEEEANWTSKTGRFTRGGRDVKISAEDVLAAKKALRNAGILEGAAEKYQKDYTAPSKEEHDKMKQKSPFEGVNGVGVVGNSSVAATAEDEETECAHPDCSRRAHMIASAGPACQKHYDDLS